MTEQELNINLEDGIKKIDESYVQRVIDYLDTKENFSNHENYIKCYSIVLHLCDALDKAKDLYEYFKKTNQNYINKIVATSLKKQKDEMLLKDFVRQWSNYTILVHFMRKMFVYLDRYYLKNTNMQTLAMSCLSFFKEKCFIEISDQLKNALLVQIAKDRDGQLVDWDLLKLSIQAFVNVGFINADIIRLGDDFVWKGDKNLQTYEVSFERYLINKSKEEYQQKSAGWMGRLNCPEYLRECEKHLLKEEERANYFLQPETKPKLLDVIHQEIIENQAARLVDKDTGCEQMFQHSKLEELALMYRIFKRVETTLKYIIEKMNPYIESRGKKIIDDEKLLKDPIEFTKKLLELKQEMDEMVEKSFQNDIKFQKNRDHSFQNFMNQCQFTPHYIASYCDHELKKGLKGLNEQQTDDRLEAIIRLFQCLHGRDLFIKSYTKFLSSRLLNKTSLSEETERQMLQKLKVECGHNTVNKISQMFTDMQLSRDLMGEFKKAYKDGLIVKVEFATEVLTNGHWPEQNTSGCKLPQDMQICTKKFEEFYKNKHQNRNLTWLYQHGTVEINPVFTQKKYTFVVNTFQAVILCLYNSNQVLTFDEIKQQTNIQDQDMTNALLYLCNPKLKILVKENATKPQFQANEKIRVNDTFQNNSIRVNFIPSQTHKKKTTEKTDVEKLDDKEIRIERQNIIDAVIVRIMKARRTEKHNQLQGDVMKQITIFLPQPQMIKQRIESLIEREYLKRDDNDRGKYIYLP